MSILTASKRLPMRGNRFTRWLGRTVLRVLGWRIAGSLPDEERIVAIAAPHTSNWDFVVGMAAVFAMGIDVTWLGKHTIFRWPFGRFFRWLGGIPVERGSRAGIVEQCVRLFSSRKKMILGLSPEGTRKRVENWKTGFFYIASQAQIPLVPVSFDYGTKILSIGTPVLCSTFDNTLETITKFYSGVQGKYPERFAMHRRASEHTDL